MNSRSVRIALGVAISCGFLFLAVRNVEWAQTLEALRAANYLYIPPLMAVSIWTLYARAQRWRVLLRPLGVPPMKHLVAATNIGFMCNMILPARAGEVIRPLIVSRRENLPLGGILATILLERIFDMFMVLLMFGGAMVFVPVSDQARNWGMALMVLAGAVALVIVVLRWQEELALGVVRHLTEYLPVKIGEPLRGFVAGFVKALEILGSPRDFLLAFAWSVWVWFVIALTNAIGLAAFHLPLRSTVIMTAIVALAVAAPGAPGFIGQFQAGCVISLGMFGVSESDAIAFSIVHHVAQFVASVGAGVYSLWQEGLTLGELSKKSAED